MPIARGFRNKRLARRVKAVAGLHIKRMLVQANHEGGTKEVRCKWQVLPLSKELGVQLWSTVHTTNASGMAGEFSRTRTQALQESLASLLQRNSLVVETIPDRSENTPTGLTVRRR
jgi:hypothetical protein